MRGYLLIPLLAGSWSAVEAHHGFGTFDMDREIEITGTVTDIAFVNPHSWLYLDVQAADGSTVAFKCEMRSATTLRRSGWSPDMFEVGNEVTITGSPDRNDPAACYVSTVIFDDGSTIDRYGQRTPPVSSQNRPREPRLANGDPNIAGEWGAEQLVMSDPRGVAGSLVPLSQAESQPGGDTEGRNGNVPLIAADAAARLFIGGVAMTPEGEAAQAALRNEVNPAMRCEPISILMDWTYDSPVNRISQSETTIELEYGKFDYSRMIHLDETSHPENLEPSLTGHSIGHWEDDVLVVDTVGIRAGPLTRGLANSDALRLIERFSLDPETMALTREFEARDERYFAAPYTGQDVVYPSNVPYQPSPCDDRSLF
ncbi:MAG: DUF6152 family protein [Gammaproteobacteria bacterium]|jgi:hypothetical protein